MACEWILLKTEALEGGVTFTRLASEQGLKVRGKYTSSSRIFFFKVVISKYGSPPPLREDHPRARGKARGPAPFAGSARRGRGCRKRAAAGRLGHVIRSRVGARTRRVPAALGRGSRRGGEGRGALAVRTPAGGALRSRGCSWGRARGS